MIIISKSFTHHMGSKSCEIVGILEKVANLLHLKKGGIPEIIVMFARKIKHDGVTIDSIENDKEKNSRNYLMLHYQTC